MEKATSESGFIAPNTDSNPYQSKAADTERGTFTPRKRTRDSVSDQLADDFFHNKNFLVEEVRKIHPELPAMWNVYKMYPRAKGGALYVDEPVRPWEVEECQKKAAIFRKLGLRYIAITPQMNLIEAIAQLGNTEAKDINGLAEDDGRADGTAKTAERQRDGQTKGVKTRHRKD